MRHDRGDRWMVVETVGDDVFVRYEEKQPPGWGDKLAAFFKRLGFTQTPGCGCAERQAKLNRFGWRVSRRLHAADERSAPQEGRNPSENHGHN